MLSSFCEWLSNTPASQLVQSVFWIIPTVQSLHIFCISIVMGSVLMLDLRLLGLAGRSQSLPALVARFVPWVWGAVLALALTGTILILGEPKRELLSQVFQLKMVLLAAVLVLTRLVQRGVRGGVDGFEGRRGAAMLLGAASFVLWVGVLAAGRWIAYLDHG